MQRKEIGREAGRRGAKGEAAAGGDAAGGGKADRRNKKPKQREGSRREVAERFERLQWEVNQRKAIRKQNKRLMNHVGGGVTKRGSRGHEGSV